MKLCVLIYIYIPNKEFYYILFTVYIFMQCALKKMDSDRRKTPPSFRRYRDSNTRSDF